MIRKLLLPLFALAILGTTFISTPVFADNFRSGTECYLFGMPSWDCNVKEITDETSLKNAFPVIATNVLNCITVIASYLVIGYIIYGGYLYMFSNGDTGKVATGKKALNQAFIGLAITLSATVILSFIRVALVGDTPLHPLDPTDDATIAADLIMHTVNQVIGFAGVVSLVFVVGGGILYITSSGDSAQLQKAKNTIKYALIGLVIVAISLTITSFMSATINKANNPDEAYLINNQKEYYEKQLS